MTPINIQVSRWNVKVKGQVYSKYVGEGGISVSQTSIFLMLCLVVQGATPWHYSQWQWLLLVMPWCHNTLGTKLRYKNVISFGRVKHIPRHVNLGYKSVSSGKAHVPCNKTISQNIENFLYRWYTTCPCGRLERSQYHMSKQRRTLIVPKRISKS